MKKDKAVGGPRTGAGAGAVCCDLYSVDRQEVGFSQVSRRVKSPCCSTVPCSTTQQNGRTVGWLVGRFQGWLAGRLVGCLVGCLVTLQLGGNLHSGDVWPQGG